MTPFDFYTRVQPRTIKIENFGCPDTGKPTLLHKIERHDRVHTGLKYVICGDLALMHYLLIAFYLFFRPGVTRSLVEVPWTFCGYPLDNVDTAGMWL